MLALLLGGVSLTTFSNATLAADSTLDEIKQLRANLLKEIAELKKREQKLHQEFLRLDQKSQLLDRQLRELRAAGMSMDNNTLLPSGAAPGVSLAAPQASAAPLPAKKRQQSRTAADSGTGVEVAQTPTQQSAPAAAQNGSAPPPGGESAPIAGPSAQQQQTKQVVETAPQLSSTGGVLTPKGQIVIDPSIEFDYWAQNQLGVNGFQIIPGITFGNIFVNRFEQYVTTGAVTVRAGLTDRIEVNAKIPYVYNTGTTTSLIPVGVNAQLLTFNASGASIGDLQFGASYQINSGENGWPILIGNGLFKTATGVSPFEVPIVTSNDPNSSFLIGLPKRLATGTGFYALEPSLTVLLPTPPGVLFGNLLYIHNLGRTQNIQNPQGGPATPVDLQPGEAIAATFGVGFSLSDRAALTLSYQQEHVFTAFANGQAVNGSPYSFGTFNFGLGYQLSQSTRLNLSVGIGAGPNTPVAKVLFEIPYKFSLF
jgi:hypothetical protein